MLPGHFKQFDYPLPQSSRSWNIKKPKLRNKLYELLGDWPPVFTPEPLIESSLKREHYILELFEFGNGIGHTVYGYLVIPKGRQQPGPAILYNHYHGRAYSNAKDEIFKKWPTKTPPAEALAKEGYVVMVIDAYCFGERKNQAPLKDHKSGPKNEEALYKMFLWQGKTLWGMIVRDDMLALNYLLSRPEVDPKRVGVMGTSMGSTRSWWLAALDERIKAAVCVACLTRYQDVIESGHINSHSIYYFVPNVLKEGIDMEAVVGLIAPRPLLTMTGTEDEGSPLPGVNKINNFAAKLYKLYKAENEFQGLTYPGLGHDFTPEMWETMLSWFREKL